MMGLDSEPAHPSPYIRGLFILMNGDRKSPIADDFQTTRPVYSFDVRVSPVFRGCDIRFLMIQCKKIAPDTRRATAI